jgi:hypothetical protein
MGRRSAWDIQDALGELRDLVRRYDSVDIPQGSRIAQELDLARRAIAAFDASDPALPDANMPPGDSRTSGAACVVASPRAESLRQR